MKGIYLTQEGKQELEAKITELDKLKREPNTILTFNEYQRIIDVYKKILESATILPVEESWNDVEFSLDFWFDDLVNTYPKGVIIKPKN